MNEDILKKVVSNFNENENVSVENLVSEYNQYSDEMITNEDFIDYMNDFDYSTGTDFYSETEDFILELVERDNLASAKSGIEILLDGDYLEDNLFMNWDGFSSDVSILDYGYLHYLIK